MNRVIDPERPVKCIYCEHKPEKGKFGDTCPECLKPEALIWNWKKKEKA